MDFNHVFQRNVPKSKAIFTIAYICMSYNSVIITFPGNQLCFDTCCHGIQCFCWDDKRSLNSSTCISEFLYLYIFLHICKYLHWFTYFYIYLHIFSYIYIILHLFLLIKKLITLVSLHSNKIVLMSRNVKLHQLKCQYEAVETIIDKLI